MGVVSNGTHNFRLLSNVADIKTLAGNDASLLQSLEPAFRKYNEQQYATVKLPGSSEAVWIEDLHGLGQDIDEFQVIVSEHNSLGDNRYFDSASQTSFQVEHSSQVRRARGIPKAALPQTDNRPDRLQHPTAPPRVLQRRPHPLPPKVLLQNRLRALPHIDRRRLPLFRRQQRRYLARREQVLSSELLERPLAVHLHPISFRRLERVDQG